MLFHGRDSLFGLDGKKLEMRVFDRSAGLDDSPGQDDAVYDEAVVMGLVSSGAWQARLAEARARREKVLAEKAKTTPRSSEASGATTVLATPSRTLPAVDPNVTLVPVAPPIFVSQRNEREAVAETPSDWVAPRRLPIADRGAPEFTSARGRSRTRPLIGHFDLSAASRIKANRKSKGWLALIAGVSVVLAVGLGLTFSRATIGSEQVLTYDLSHSPVLSSVAD